MLMAKIMRILRSRITLSVISGLGILYIISILLWNFNSDDLIETESGTIRRPQEFKWGSDETVNASRTAVTTCRNSIQGKVLLADDQVSSETCAYERKVEVEERHMEEYNRNEDEDSCWLNQYEEHPTSESHLKHLTRDTGVRGVLQQSPDNAALQGFVCHRVDQLSTGCCNSEVETTQKYACDTCNKHGCCAIYEYCVSCCLHPDKLIRLAITDEKCQPKNTM